MIADLLSKGIALVVGVLGVGTVALCWALPKEFGVALALLVGLAGGAWLAGWKQRHS